MPGKRKTPTALLEDRGTFAKDPKRGEARANEVMPAPGIGDPPSYMTKSEKAVWDEIKGRCHPNVLRQGDEIAFETLVVMVAEFREDRRGFKKISQMLSGLDRFGLTPSGRANIKEPPENRKPKGFGSLRGGHRPGAT